MEAISWIKLSHVHWSTGGVQICQLGQCAWECMTKLHGFRWSHGIHVLIHPAEGAITNHSGLSFMLGNNSWRTQTKFFEFQDSIHWWHHPKLLVNHISKFFAHKIGTVRC